MDSEFRPFLDNLIKKFEATYGKEPLLLFSTPSGTEVTTMAQWQKGVMDSLFGKQKFNYTPNSMRKWWETVFQTTNDVPEDLHEAFESQSGHSKKTGKNSYVKPTSNVKLGKLFSFLKERLTQGVPFGQIAQQTDAINETELQNEDDQDQCDHAQENDGVDNSPKTSKTAQTTPLKHCKLDNDYDENIDDEDIDDEEYDAVPKKRKTSTQQSTPKCIDYEEDENEKNEDKSFNQSRYAEALTKLRSTKIPWSVLSKQVLTFFKDAVFQPSRRDVRDAFLQISESKSIDEYEFSRTYTKIAQAAAKFLK